MLADPQVQARELLRYVEYPGAPSPVPLADTAVRLSATLLYPGASRAHSRRAHRRSSPRAEIFRGRDQIAARRRSGLTFAPPLELYSKPSWQLQKTALREKLRAFQDRSSSSAIAFTPTRSSDSRREDIYLLAQTLDQAGFKVEKGTAGMETAFLARAGSGPLHIGICAEYDSLPDIGHACGHNDRGERRCTHSRCQHRRRAGAHHQVIGTPAEEVGNASGKILLLERGALPVFTQP